MTIAEKITVLRESCGLSKYDLADKTGIAPQLIYKYESGEIEKISIKTIEKISSALNVSPADLAGWTDHSPVNGQPCKIPVCSEIIDGIPVFDHECRDKYVYYTPGSAEDSVMALKVGDDSMWPMIQEGDVAIICRQSEIENNDIAALILDASAGKKAVLRKIKYSMDGMSCIPLNPNRETTAYSWRKVEELGIRIIGKCVEIHKFL